ncbi:MAG: choice-of-anchor L domain-containing protein [Nannocystaceae bacterium]
MFVCLVPLGCGDSFGFLGTGEWASNNAASVGLTTTGASQDTSPGPGTDSTASTEGTDGSGSAGTDGSSGGSGASIKFDVGAVPEGTSSTGVDPCETGGTAGCECTIPDHTPCDAGTTDPFLAMGVNCPGEFQTTAVAMGNPGAIGIRALFGPTPTFNPREGQVYAVIGSGLVADLNNATPPGDNDAGPTHCNDDLGAYDKGATLPQPIMTNPVGGDCTQNAGLIGTGDCSNTIQNQFNQGTSANDYTELRIIANVPPDVTSFSYDFAFFTVEWPYYANSQYNDMYVGWLSSEVWTGNISFDNNGNPISLNASFLDFTDQGGGLQEFAGTCMRQHAGTSWLSTTAGVAPGEQITIVFAIMDLSDSILDSYVFLDNFQWGCEAMGKPMTEPVG